jgi:hypothetical protein
MSSNSTAAGPGTVASSRVVAGDARRAATPCRGRRRSRGQVRGQISRPDTTRRHLTPFRRFRVTMRIPSTSSGAVRPPGPFAMQKVVGSSPIIRSLSSLSSFFLSFLLSGKPRSSGVFVSWDAALTRVERFSQPSPSSEGRFGRLLDEERMPSRGSVGLGPQTPPPRPRREEKAAVLASSRAPAPSDLARCGRRLRDLTLRARSGPDRPLGSSVPSCNYLSAAAAPGVIEREERRQWSPAVGRT